MKIKILIASFILCVSVLLALLLKIKSEQSEMPTLSKMAMGGNFEIPSTKGFFKLEDYKGKVVILYFGYTFCPDICPTTLSTLGAVLRKLTPEQLNQIQVVFISVDPKRDTLDKLKTYSEFFHESIIGATDTEEKIAKIAKLYGVAYEKHFPKAGDPNYSVDHSTQAFIIDQSGALVELISHGETTDQIETQLKTYIEE